MKTNIREMSPSALARFAGVLYLVITVAAIFAHMVIPEQFIVVGDVATTAANITANATTFRLGTVGSELLILLSEIVLAVVLYVLLYLVLVAFLLIEAITGYIVQMMTEKYTDKDDDDTGEFAAVARVEVVKWFALIKHPRTLAACACCTRALS